jgi:hypothetical protein
VADLGPPTSYLAVSEGVPVYSSDGKRFGELTHVLADEEKDIFDGLVVRAERHRFVDAPHVRGLFENGVELDLTYEEAEQLPEPSENPGVLRVDPADAEEGRLAEKLRRAWDLISGRG